MSDRAPGWVVPVMRAGYAARGAVYVIVGIIAISAAWTGGRAEGTQGALASLRDEPFGQALLWIIAIGLIAYAIWRALAAAMDLDSHGSDGKGMIARSGMTVSAILHAALGVSAVRLATGGGSGGGGSTEDWTAQLMSQPFGQWLVGIAGACVIGAGAYYAHKGWTGKYKRRLRRNRTTERLDPACKWGLVAHGIVVGIIGGFLVYAAWTADPSQAGGIGQAFASVREVAFGRILLGLLGLGMLGFAIYCFIEAVYRIVPRRAGDDVTTLASEAKSKAKSAARKAQARAT